MERVQFWRNLETIRYLTLRYIKIPFLLIFVLYFETEKPFRHHAYSSLFKIMANLSMLNVVDRLGLEKKLVRITASEKH